MSEKWFVFKSGLPDGPFLKKELLLKLENNEISENALIWDAQNGKEWVPIRSLDFDDVTTLEEKEELPPDIVMDSAFLVDTLPELPSIDNNPLVEKKRSSFKFFFKLFILLIGLSFLIFLIVRLLTVYKGEPISFDSISEDDRILMQKITLLESRYQIVVGASLDVNSKHLWFYSNRKGPLNLNIELKAINDQILSKNSVEIINDLVIKNHHVKLKDPTFLVGSNIFAGRYTLKYTVYDTSFFANLMTVLKSIPFIGEIGRIKHYKITDSLTKIILLYNGRHAAFENRLAQLEKSEAVSTNNQEALPASLPKSDTLDLSTDVEIEKFNLSLKETYSTYLVIIKKVEELYLKKLAIFTKGTSTQFFTRDYGVEIAPFYQEILAGIPTDALLNNPKVSHLSAQRDLLFEDGKEIGRIVFNAAEAMSGHIRLSAKVKENLKKDFEKDVLTFKELIQKRLAEINKQ